MSAEIAAPNLPQKYQALFTDSDRQVHEELAQTSLSEFVDQMDSAELRVYESNQGERIKFVNIRHDDEADSNEAVVMPLPFGNGYSPAMFIRAMAKQKMLREPKRILMFPNNGVGRFNKWYELPGQEPMNGSVADSYYPDSAKEQLADAITGAVANEGVKTVHIDGYSQAATIGASILASLRGQFEVASAFLGDPANVEYRTAKKLQADFRGKGSEGLKSLNRAINDSAIPALTEAQHSGPSLAEKAKQLLMFAQFGLGSKLPINSQLQKDMTRPDFGIDLGRAGFNPATGGHLPSYRNMMVVRMQDSLVCTPAIVRDMDGANLSRYVEIVEGYGHEGGDNVILNSILSRLAIEGRL